MKQVEAIIKPSRLGEVQDRKVRWRPHYEMY